MKRVGPILLLILVFSNHVRADWAVSRFINSESFVISRTASDSRENPPLREGGRVLIFSQSVNRVVGYGAVEKLGPTGAVIKVLYHPSDRLILPGDRVVTADFTKEVPDYYGRAQLLLKGNRNYSSRYKPLASFGPFTGDGTTLDKGEALVDILGIVQYGVTHDISLITTVPFFFVGYPNFGAKFRLYESDDLVFTQSVSAFYSIHDKEPLFQLRSLISTPSNSRLISHTAITIVVDPASILGSKKNRVLATTTIKNGWEYLLGNWDRLLFGPTYNFDLQTIGGYFSYLFVWDHLHVGLGVETNDFTALRISASDAYFPTGTLYWRF